VNAISTTHANTRSRPPEHGAPLARTWWNYIGSLSMNTHNVWDGCESGPYYSCEHVVETTWAWSPSRKNVNILYQDPKYDHSLDMIWKWRRSVLLMRTRGRNLVSMEPFSPEHEHEHNTWKVCMQSIDNTYIFIHKATIWVYMFIIAGRRLCYLEPRYSTGSTQHRTGISRGILRGSGTTVLRQTSQ